MQTAPRISPSEGPVVAQRSDLPDLSVVIVNYNVRPFLEQALISVFRACEGIEAEVFVIDNNSVDGSAEMVRTRFPSVHLVENEENVGFARANNQGIRPARGRFLLILNPDTIVQEDTVVTLLRFMEDHPAAGAVGCRILNPDGSFAPESRRTFPSPAVAFYRISGLSRLFPKSRVFGRYNLSYLPQDQVAEVDALSGSCMLVRRAALAWSEDQIRRMEEEGVDGDLAWASAPDGCPPEGRGAGLLDEDFFMYGEDLDWCFRIQQAGWKIFYTPETQIIHYKGESTKQGELRYVRLFYGAMLLFIRKHFHGRYSGIFAWMLRAGIVLRAALSVMASGIRELKGPLAELVVVGTVVAGAGAFSAWNAGKSFGPLFYLLVTPAYALLTVVSIAAAGGYRPSRRGTLRPVLTGVGAAFVAASVVSFFVRTIAYSRAMVLLGFAGSAVVLALIRWVGRSRQNGRKRALLVGSIDEARRLHRILAGSPDPPLQLIGHVPPDSEVRGLEVSPNGLLRLGTLRQLRDVVRVRRIDYVVFSAADVSNRSMFGLMQQIRDLPVQFRVFAQDSNQLIGKASIEDLSTPLLVGAEISPAFPRSRLTRRLFEIPVALILMALYPVAQLVSTVARGRRAVTWRRIRTRLAGLPAVLTGRRALVGYNPSGRFSPPAEWGIEPGLFPVVSDRSAGLLSEAELGEAYWLYARNQSVALDLGIALRRLSSEG